VNEYLAARHVTVVYPNRARLGFDVALESLGVRRDFVAAVAGFSGVPAFLRGTDRLATLPRLLGASLMRDFSAVAAPAAGKAGELSMSLVWHRRHALDPGMTFVRSLLVRHSAEALREARQAVVMRKPSGNAGPA
jgi:hypothetical protein